MIVLVDMDDVLEQLVVGWCQYLNERYGTCTTEADVTSWNMAAAFPTLTPEQVYGAADDDALWDYVKPMPGAREGLRKLRTDGHEIYVVTASHYNTLRAKMENVLFRYFPELDWSHVILTTNKHLVRGDVLVDDGVHNLMGGCYRKILFHAYHNADFDEASVGAVRVYDWDGVYQAICRIAEEKRAVGEENA